MSGQTVYLDQNLRSSESQALEEGLRQRIVGQDEAVQAVVDLYQVFRAGLHSVGRPIGNLLFLGPTGAGKTRIVEAAAEVLFGDARAVIKVDCAEFQHSHEIAKLIGSPPGYIGHRETQPVITQEAIELHYTDSLKMAFLLFDEIEKASDALWQLLLGILDKATLTLGDNRRVNLSRAIIFMTSNLGGREIAKLTNGRLGFTSSVNSEPESRMNERVEHVACEAAKRKFAPEFLNRIDKLVVFHPLRMDQLQQILDIELQTIRHRISEGSNIKFDFQLTEQAKSFLLTEGTDSAYGARHLKRAIERHVVYPLAKFVATEQVLFGDVISIDWEGKNSELQFTKTRGAFADGAPGTQCGAEAAAPNPEGRAESIPASTGRLARSAAEK